MNKMPDESTIRSWVQLHRIHRKLQDEVESSLKASGLPPLDWYDVLLELHRAGSSGLRQYEISGQVLLNKHNLSRLIDRLEKNQLVQRYASSEDGRGNQVKITRKGEKVLKEIWPVYGQTIQEQFEQKLTKKDIQDLTRLMKKLQK